MVVLFMLINCKGTELNEVKLECVSGVIVGFKCEVAAIKLDSAYRLGKTSWSKDTLDSMGEDSLISKTGVIGLIGLPERYAKENRRIYLLLRKPSKEEDLVLDCYLESPVAPAPRYIVAKADSVSCPKDSIIVL